VVRKETANTEVGWDEAIAHVASEFKTFRKGEIAVVASARLTNEELFALLRFARDVVATKHLAVRRHVVPGDEDALLIRADKTPNSRGAEEMGIPGATADEPLQAVLHAVRDGSVRGMFIVDENLADDPETAKLLGKLDFLVAVSSTESETTRMADVVLPLSTFAEKNGTFTNFAGQVQRIRPAVATLEADRALDGFAMSRLDRSGSTFDRWAKGAKRDARPGWRIITGIASLMGVKVKYGTAEDVFGDLAAHVEPFHGMTYRTLSSRGLPLRARKDAPAPAAH
jgi:NADH-quinone oxidoreductase subunit G